MKKISAVAMVLSVVAVALLLTVMAGLNGVSAQTGDYDADNDGLIEITYLEQLNAMRWDLNGDGVADEGADADGYRSAFPGAIARMGCPQSGCEGYELARSLNFDDAVSYASGTVNTSWTSGTGWPPIVIGIRGHQPFRTVLEGNDHTITNLFINHSGENTPSVAGLFGWSEGDIRNVGLVDVDITAGVIVGGLVGINDGDIVSSYATGHLTGASAVGGLIGGNYGSISSSYATGNVSGSSGVGGLVGSNNGDIVSSYATGHLTGVDAVGGLVGDNFGGISSSYATGNVSGRIIVGGLVGVIYDGSISSSYATGNVSGDRWVGGLVGDNFGGISSSYATGSVSGDEAIGGLVGHSRGGITSSYWNTETSGQSRGVGEYSDNVEGKTTAELQAPTGYTGIYAPWHLDFDNADGDSDPTTGRDDFWDFGTSSQYPALKVDFDGDGTATWQEFGNQHNRPEPIVTPVPTYTPIPTPIPVVGQDVLNRLSALEALVATLQNRFSTSESLVMTLRDRLSASESAVTALQNRVTALEGGTSPPQPTATPIPIPTATPTPRPGEPTPTPAPTMTPVPTATPQSPAELSLRTQEIEAAVKAYLEDAGEPTTDGEIVAACRHLRDSHWDFFGLPLATPDRDYNIAAAIFLNTSSAFEIQIYCDEKQGI